MKRDFTIIVAVAAAWIAYAMAPPVVTAETTEFGMTIQQNGAREQAPRPPLFNSTLETSYTTPGKAKFQGVSYGESGAYNLRAGLGSALPLGREWSVPLELRFQTLYLGTLPGVPIPGQIATLHFGTGLRYRPNDRWSFVTLVTPALYKFSDVGGNDIGISGAATAIWNYSRSVKYAFGIIVAPDSDIRVLPVAGVDWAINDLFDLRLMFPKPRLIYTPGGHWRVHAGADFNMATFRTGNTLGTSIGLPQYNDALATYRDIRTGAGIGYRFRKALTVEAEGGYSVNRQLDYRRLGQRVEFDPAPYASFSLRLLF
ncbi:DUF6268 family outer membrane beta-barrel protein [Geomonas sp. Red32]|uniref:DUF6268 family outer membrane beta-barrel protein n=1 Tax=Geomonas sp. Red32 TaxID=2912856 RepID=UPI00202CEE8B|nr:DUF6268 family outer membrane beta-barrel protein [Geomonas sp. Red32]MCM0080565.1 DUF6268 family outer membrane beta-barrel protein [Geomonas sp. Red32]